MTQQPTIVFVHGVGMWPGLFADLRLRLRGRHKVIARPGYDGRPSVSTFDDQVEQLRQVVISNAPAVVIGISGGATLGLALAVDAPTGLVGLLTHEPLVGPLAPQLHDRVEAFGHRLAASPSPDAATEFLASLYGPATWGSLPGRARSWGQRHWRTVCAEVQHFASFAPSKADLEGIAIPHVNTLGLRSPSERSDVAATLVETGAQCRTLHGSGHLALVDSPTLLAEATREVMASVGEHKDRARP